MRRAAAIAAVLLLLGPSTPALGAASLTDIEDEVMCTVCGTALNIAGGPAAEDQRELIRELIAEGKDKDQIKDALVAEYGESVLALPEGGGFELAAYLVPIALGLAAIGGLAFALPRWRSRRAAEPFAGTAAAVPSDADLARLEQDLARHDP